jgi:hypothetical protein
MAILRGLMLGCFVLVIAGCGGSKPKDLIVGKWKSEKKEKLGDKEMAATIIAEFKSDGTMKLGMSMKIPGMPDAENSMEGKYKLVDDDKAVEATMTPPGKKEETKKIKIEKLTSDTLILVDEEKGKTEKMEFKRQ